MPHPIRSIRSAYPELPTATTKLRFLKRADSSLASEDDALILSIRAELLERPNIVEEGDCGEADAILMHESWAFREWRYIDKLLADPVIGRYSPKVYTVNNDDAATGLLFQRMVDANGRARRVGSGRIEDDAARRAVLCAGANCNRSSGNWSLTHVPEPTRLTRYPSVRNCSKTLTTTRRDIPCCLAKSRVAGRRMPRLSRPVSIAVARLQKSVASTGAGRRDGGTSSRQNSPAPVKAAPIGAHTRFHGS